MGHKDGVCLLTGCEFQSTHPVWDGTGSRCRRVVVDRHFNPPIPCGMGQTENKSLYRQDMISIHPSRVGWDYKIHLPVFVAQISIHPSRVGWDVGSVASMPGIAHFNPPIPCGMGLFLLSIKLDYLPNFNPPIPCGMGREVNFVPGVVLAFQSTHPVWDGTALTRSGLQRWRFQSTHPVWDGTKSRLLRGKHDADFNPPIPCGMGRATIRFVAGAFLFQSTHPVWDGTSIRCWAC